MHNFFNKSVYFGQNEPNSAIYESLGKMCDRWRKNNDQKTHLLKEYIIPSIKYSKYEIEALDEVNPLFYDPFIAYRAP